MKFDTEATQTQFHKLATQVQCDWLVIEDIARKMFCGELECVAHPDGGLEVRIRVNIQNEIRAIGL